MINQPPLMVLDRLLTAYEKVVREMAGKPTAPMAYVSCPHEGTYILALVFDGDTGLWPLSIWLGHGSQEDVIGLLTS